VAVAFTVFVLPFILLTAAAIHLFTVQQLKATQNLLNSYFNVAPTPMIEISSELPPILLGRTSDSITFSQLSSGLTPLDYAHEAGHHSIELLLKITASTMQPTLQSTRARVVTMKSNVKTPVKPARAPSPVASCSIDRVAKIERPTRKSAQKHRVF
jgi:hypothetical protein